MSFVGSYVWQIRESGWGKKLLIGMGSEVLVTNSKGQVLLGLRSEGDGWASFGGHLDPKELMRDCAVREVLEETGVKLDKEKLIPFGYVANVVVEFRDGNEMQTTGLLFTCEYDEFPAGGDGEYSKFGWFDLESLPEPLQPFSRESLRMYKAWRETGQFQVD